MLNRVQLIGNLGNDPDIRMMQEGREIASFSLATNSSWKDVNEEWQKRTEWHTIIVYKEGLVSRVKDTLKKGDTVFVEGKLSYAQWENKSGEKKKMAHIVISGLKDQIQYLRSSKSEQKEESAKVDKGEYGLQHSPLGSPDYNSKSLTTP